MFYCENCGLVGKGIKQCHVVIEKRDRQYLCLASGRRKRELTTKGWEVIKERIFCSQCTTQSPGPSNKSQKSKYVRRRQWHNDFRNKSKKWPMRGNKNESSSNQKYRRGTPRTKEEGRERRNPQVMQIENVLRKAQPEKTEKI